MEVKWLKSTEAANLLGIHPNTIMRRLQSGKLYAIKPGGNWLFPFDGNNRNLSPADLKDVEIPEDKELPAIESTTIPEGEDMDDIDRELLEKGRYYRLLQLRKNIAELEGRLDKPAELERRERDIQEKEQGIANRTENLNEYERRLSQREAQQEEIADKLREREAAVTELEEAREDIDLQREQLATIRSALEEDIDAAQATIEEAKSRWHEIEANKKRADKMLQVMTGVISILNDWEKTSKKDRAIKMQFINAYTGEIRTILKTYSEDVEHEQESIPGSTGSNQRIYQG